MITQSLFLHSAILNYSTILAKAFQDGVEEQSIIYVLS